MMEKLKRFFVKEEESVKKPEQNSDMTEEKAEDIVINEDTVTEKDIYGYTLGEIKEIAGSSGDDDMLSDLLSEQFSSFAKGRSGGLGEKYTAFKELKKLMAADEERKNPARGLSGQEARAHSGFSGTPVKDISSGLTKRQMDMAKSAGMSFREYEELLNSVPAKVKNKF